MNHMLRNKVLNKIKTKDAPITAANGQPQMEILTALKQQLQLSPGIQVEYPVTWSRPKREMLRINFNYKHIDVFFEDDVLQLQLGYNGHFPVSNLAQVTLILEAVKEAMREEKERELKKDKVRSLLSRSIESKVKLLAQELKFDYHLDSMKTKLKLSVRINAQYGIVVDIPYAKFQEVLSGLRTLIQTIFELYGQGIRFKVTGIQDIRYWTSYKDGKQVS